MGGIKGGKEDQWIRSRDDSKKCGTPPIRTL